MEAQELLQELRTRGYSDTQIKNIMADGKYLGMGGVTQETAEEVFNYLSLQKTPQAKQIKKIQLLLDEAKAIKIVSDRQATYYAAAGAGDDCIAVAQHEQAQRAQGACTAYKEAIKILQES